MAARQASTSFPSTRMLGMPKPGARPAMGYFACTVTGSEIAQWLLVHTKTTGARYDEANTMASFTSPWLEAPSPKYATET